jgi:hypothetical protein
MFALHLSEKIRIVVEVFRRTQGRTSYPVTFRANSLHISANCIHIGAVLEEIRSEFLPIHHLEVRLHRGKLNLTGLTL